jgi:hypothetical protein
MCVCSFKRDINSLYRKDKLMGTMDQPTGSVTKRQIKVVDLSGLTISQIESTYNTNYGQKGWRIVQFFIVSNKNYILCEKEV